MVSPVIAPNIICILYIKLLQFGMALVLQTTLVASDPKRHFRSRSVRPVHFGISRVLISHNLPISFVEHFICCRKYGHIHVEIPFESGLSTI